MRDTLLFDLCEGWTTARAPEPGDFLRGATPRAFDPQVQSTRQWSNARNSGFTQWLEVIVAF